MYSLIRQLLFLLDAEDAHDFVARRIESLPPIVLDAIAAICRPPTADRRLFGLNFPSPIGIAALCASRSGERTRLKISSKLKVPKNVQTIISPTTKPASPTRLTMNALLEAFAALVRSK